MQSDHASPVTVQAARRGAAQRRASGRAGGLAATCYFRRRGHPGRAALSSRVHTAL